MKIYGKNPVLERLKADPKSVKRIFVVAGHPEHSYIATKARKHGIPVLVVHPGQMLKLGKSQNTQGLLMDVEDFAYVDFDDLLDQAIVEKLTLVFLDSLTDPQNLGAILRSTGSLGGFAVVLPTHESVEVTDTVMRVAWAEKIMYVFPRSAIWAMRSTRPRKRAFGSRAASSRTAKAFTRPSSRFPWGW